LGVELDTDTRMMSWILRFVVLTTYHVTPPISVARLDNPTSEMKHRLDTRPVHCYPCQDGSIIVAFNIKHFRACCDQSRRLFPLWWWRWLPFVLGGGRTMLRMIRWDTVRAFLLFEIAAWHIQLDACVPTLDDTSTAGCFCFCLS
jgi:hypothetical protein